LGHCCRAAEQGKQAYIYQFGDHDPSGVIIPKTIERRLNEMCEKFDCSPPIVARAVRPPDPGMKR
jgi:hypothetical protein